MHTDGPHERPDRRSTGFGPRMRVGLLLAVLLSIAAAGLYEWLPRRTQVVEPTDEYRPAVYSDKDNAGGSEARRGPGPGLELLCTLREGFRHPYCGMVLQFDPRRLHGRDLSDVHSLRVWLTYQGPAKTVCLMLRNASASYGIPMRTLESAKYNQAEFSADLLRDGMTEVKMTDFFVSEWWMKQFHIPPDQSHPEFDNIIGLEITPGSGAPLGNYRFVLTRLEYDVKWVSRVHWYLAIVGAWLLVAAMWLLPQLPRRLRERRHDKQAAPPATDGA